MNLKKEKSIFLAIEMIYFDANANHPMLKCAKKGYLDAVEFNNISAVKDPEAMKIIDELRSLLQALHGDYDVVFTSGGSESNSTIIYQLIHEYIMTGRKPRVICSTAEHASVSIHLQQLEEQNIIDINWIKPDSTGMININKVDGKVSMIFAQSVNSETGTIQNIADIQKITGEALLAVDNVQGFMKRKYPKNVGNFISISFHKIGGPIGVGALLIRKGTPFYPMIGGKQNNGLRGGTYNIGGLSASLCAMKSFNYAKAKNIGLYFWNKLSKKIAVIEYDKIIETRQIPKGPYIIRFSTMYQSLPHVAFICLANGSEIKCGTMVKNMLYKKGVVIATGSACNNESATIIGSMNSADIHQAVKKGFIRISFSEKNNKLEVDQLINIINAIIVNDVL